MGTREVAEVLGVDPATVLRMVEREEIVAEVKGPGQTGAFMFSKREVNRSKRTRDKARRARLAREAESAEQYTPDEIAAGAS